ncbi:MAG TPA: DUF1684 domain-containing protein [Labilithrix sp.]
MSDWRADLESLYSARIARLRSDRGWLSLVGKIFLADGRVELGSDPSCGARLPDGAPAHAGTLEIAGTRVRFVGDAKIGGERVTDRVLRSDAHGAADRLEIGGFVVELMERGETIALRVRDVRELPLPFAGIERFPVDEAWRKDARLVPHASKTRIAIEYEGATDGAVEDTMESPGILVFDVPGERDRRVEMDALVESGGKRLYVPFRDKSDAYSAGRFVYAPMPDADGRVILDFNAAMLPGCAFTSFATCPIPPPRNRLRFAVTAGEQRYLAEPLGY